jgi:hypothetical protein
MNAWSHLPNAKYIDLILADLKKNPDDWSHAYSVVKRAAYNAVFNTVWNAVWNAARYDAWDAAKNAANNAANGAILALIAYDYCSWILNEKPEDIKLLAVLTQEPQYVLLYPAVLALEKSKEIS